jgi:hypothetical protein
MFKRLQLILGVVVLQVVSINAMENKASNSPRTPRAARNPLSCSQEVRLRDNGDFAPIAGLKRSLERRKEEQNNTSHMYYPWPGANPDFSCSTVNLADQMKPWHQHFL